MQLIPARGRLLHIGDSRKVKIEDAAYPREGTVTGQLAKNRIDVNDAT